MSTPWPNRLLTFLLVAAALIILALRSAPVPEAPVCKEEAPTQRLEAAGTQLLWESLSRQFVEANPF